MNNPSIAKLKKILVAIKHAKTKVVTSETLSRDVGLYPEAINDLLSFFDPLVTMDFTYDLKSLVEPIEAWITAEDAKKEKKPSAPRLSKKAMDQYESINEFIYAKLTIGGIVDKTVQLSDLDLRALKRLVSSEQAKRKALKSKKK